MNYLAHGYQFLDQPFFLAGTAVPDWLSVVNRKVRVRGRLVQPVVAATTCPDTRAIGLGILQHHSDDDAFHRLAHFMQLEAELSVQFRRQMPDRFDHRPGFLGHIVVELMLDALLATMDGTLLDRYYAALQSVRAQMIEDTVNLMANQTTDRLAWFIQRFHEEKFLYDYLDDHRMLLRLNQVLKRVKLLPLAADAVEVLAYARRLLQQHGPKLLQAMETSPRIVDA